MVNSCINWWHYLLGLEKADALPLALHSIAGFFLPIDSQCIIAFDISRNAAISPGKREIITWFISDITVYSSIYECITSHKIHVTKQLLVRNMVYPFKLSVIFHSYQFDQSIFV